MTAFAFISGYRINWFRLNGHCILFSGKGNQEDVSFWGFKESTWSSCREGRIMGRLLQEVIVANVCWGGALNGCGSLCLCLWGGKTVRSIGNESPSLSIPVPLDMWNNYFLIPWGAGVSSESCDSQIRINEVKQK